jgi:hypothetical protein
LEWSPGATEDWTALATAYDKRGTLWALDAILALAQLTVPGRSLLGRVLRDPKIWPHLQSTLQRAADPQDSIHHVKYGFTLGGLELEAEELARAEGSRNVCERHLAGALQKSGQTTYNNFGLQIDRVVIAVHDIELGPGFQPTEIHDRWHGIIDTSIAIEYQDLHNIDWLAETGAKAVTIWISPVLLDELDNMKFSSRDARIKRRAQVFTRWVQPILSKAVTSAGAPIRPGVLLRAWAPMLEQSAPDSRHLEAAFALLDRQVPVKLITGDSGQRLRALAHGVEVFDLDERWLLPTEQAGKASS